MPGRILTGEYDLACPGQDAYQRHRAHTYLCKHTYYAWPAGRFSEIIETWVICLCNFRFALVVRIPTSFTVIFHTDW